MHRSTIAYSAKLVVIFLHYLTLSQSIPICEISKIDGAVFTQLVKTTQLTDLNLWIKPRPKFVWINFSVNQDNLQISEEKFVLQEWNHVVSKIWYSFESATAHKCMLAIILNETDVHTSILTCPAEIIELYNYTRQKIYIKGEAEVSFECNPEGYKSALQHTATFANNIITVCMIVIVVGGILLLALIFMIRKYKNHLKEVKAEMKRFHILASHLAERVEGHNGHIDSNDKEVMINRMDVTNMIENDNKAIAERSEQK